MILRIRDLKLGEWCRVDNDGDPIEPGTKVTEVDCVNPQFRTTRTGIDEVKVDLVVGEARTTVAV